MQFEILNNSNSEPIWRWIFRKQDDLNQIVFIFLSLTNANNARYGPLFEFTSNVRIVYFKGLRCKYTDRVMLYVFKKFINILRIRINRYEVIHLLSLSKVFYNKIQVFHNDDPLYTNDELSELKLWQDANLENNRTPILICTNEYSFNWYSDVLLKVKIVIIEQGFYESMKPNSYIIADRFSCVYSSPYIHYGEDLHGNHTTWGANVLIDQIIPKLFKADPEIEVRLIGELGKDARKKLTKYTNWHSYGRVGLLQNHEIISRCSIGIYPRIFDHKRSILKIFSYLGGGLPVVTFDLIDTNIVKEFDLGPVVSSVEDFVENIIKLKNSPDLMKFYRKNIQQLNSSFTWKELSKKMELELAKFEN